MLLALLRQFARWPLGLVHPLGVLLGWLVYAVSPTYRKRLKAHAHQAGYDQALIRRAVGHAGRMASELPSLWLRPRTEPLGARLVSTQGADLVDAALARGRGLVLLTPHLGAFEVAAQAYAERFGAAHPMTAMYRPARKAWLREVQLTARDREGLLVAPASLAGIRQMMKALRHGDCVGLLPDQVPPKGMGVWAPFFGKSAYTMTLAARLAEQTGAALLLISCQREPMGRGYSLRYEAMPEALPEPPAKRGLGAAGVAGAGGAGGADEAAEQAHQAACAATINRAMELMIRRMPEQYLWGYHRYKEPRLISSDTTSRGDAP